MLKELEHFIKRQKEAIREAENTGEKVKVRKARLNQNGSVEFQKREWLRKEKNAFSKLLRQIKMICKFL